MLLKFGSDTGVGLRHALIIGDWKLDFVCYLIFGVWNFAK